MIEETMQEGQLTQDDEADIKGSVSMMYAGPCCAPNDHLVVYLTRPTVRKAESDTVSRILPRSLLPRLTTALRL